MLDLKIRITKVIGLVSESKKQLREYLEGIQKFGLNSESNVSLTMLQLQYIKSEKSIYT